MLGPPLGRSAAHPRPRPLLRTVPGRGAPGAGRAGPLPDRRRGAAAARRVRVRRGSTRVDDGPRRRPTCSSSRPRRSSGDSSSPACCNSSTAVRSAVLADRAAAEAVRLLQRRHARRGGRRHARPHHRPRAHTRAGDARHVDAREPRGSDRGRRRRAARRRRMGVARRSTPKTPSGRRTSRSCTTRSSRSTKRTRCSTTARRSSNYAAQYGSLWPYVFAAGMSLFGKTIGVWVDARADRDRRRHARDLRRPAACGAQLDRSGCCCSCRSWRVSFTRIGGTPDNRYSFENYFGTFPLRYAGPSILAWLVARHLGGDRPRASVAAVPRRRARRAQQRDVGLGAAARDVRGAAVGGRRPSWRRLGRLALEAVAGVAAAFALVSVLTLAREGALPDLGLLMRFSRLFGARTASRCSRCRGSDCTS